MKNLEQWSLLGISEYRAFHQFQEQLRATTGQLAAFFHRANGWAPDAATKLASDALKGAVSLGIRFYQYNPSFATGEQALRKAILEKRDIDFVRAIPFDGEQLDAKTNLWGGGPGSRETILSIAIGHPEALSFLLRSGVNPNHANDFGKTALMHAAQHNQIEAARLLIEQGADVNAVTIRPANNCYYTLQTFNVTPLHYAVRNASPELIRLLLDSGAQAFVTAKNHRSYPMAEETPLDWLHRYTAPAAAEKNPNIPEERIAEIEKWLAPLPPEQRAETAAGYVIKAEAAYRKGDVAQAYLAISLARQLQPDNTRALSDLSLIAMKNGKFGESLEASRHLIESQVDDKTRANAWFNQGLACEEYKAKGGGRFLAFNGDNYCTYGLLHPYLKAYEAGPTAARGNKLKALFDNRVVPYCEVRAGSGTIKINFQNGADPESRKHRQLQTLYVLHGRTEEVSGENFAWDVNFYGGETSSIILDDKVLSVFKTSVTFVQFPYRVFGATCTERGSTEMP
ncbi:MAG: ankyrin repeat domain-containing protein [Magnetospirillum sp. WYHS-4]